MVAGVAADPARRVRVFAVLFAALLIGWIAATAAQSGGGGFESDAVELGARPAINYRLAARTDAVAQLSERLLAGVRWLA